MDLRVPMHNATIISVYFFYFLFHLVSAFISVSVSCSCCCCSCSAHRCAFVVVNCIWLPSALCCHFSPLDVSHTRVNTGKPSLARMASNADLEKGLESGTNHENGTAPSESTFHSDIEKAEENGINTPDPGHDEVEQMDEGHLDDLARQHVGSTLFPRNDSLLIYTIRAQLPSRQAPQKVLTGSRFHESTPAPAPEPSCHE